MIQRMKRSARTLITLNALIWMGFATPVQANGFQSPSGNIVCYADVYGPAAVDDMALVCLIFDAGWDLPPDYGDSDPTCDLDRTRTLILPRSGRPQERWSCHGDVFWPLPLGTISYGSEWSVFNYTCKVASNGVTCTNGEATMFISRATRSFF